MLEHEGASHCTAELVVENIERTIDRRSRRVGVRGSSNGSRAGTFELQEIDRHRLMELRREALHTRKSRQFRP